MNQEETKRNIFFHFERSLLTDLVNDKKYLYSQYLFQIADA